MSEAQDRPSVLFRPNLKRWYVSHNDADHSREWEAFYGREKDDYYSGVKAFGSTPEEAMLAFDLAFVTGHNEVTYKWDYKWVKEEYERSQTKTQTVAGESKEGKTGTLAGTSDGGRASA